MPPVTSDHREPFAQDRLSWLRTILAVASLVIYASAVVSLHQERRAQFAVDVYGLAGAVSNLVYGAPVGAIYAGVLAPFLESTRPVEQVLEETARGQVQTGALLNYAPDGNGIGYVAATNLAMRLFGLHLSSMTFLLLCLMAASTVAFLWRYRDERAFVVPLYFFSLTIMLFTWLVSDRHIADQIPIGGMRYYSVAAIPPAMHLLLEIADTQAAAAARIRNLALLAVQLLLLAAVVFIRPSAAYLPMAIAAGALLVMWARRRDRAALRTIIGKGAYLVALAGILAGLAVLWMPKDYLEAGRATPALWHRLLLSLGAHPAWPYGNLRDIYRCDKSWAIPEGLIPGIVDRNAQCIWVSYGVAHGMAVQDIQEQYLGGRYEAAMRGAFFDIAREYPAQVLATFLYYKPRMALLIIGRGMRIDLALQPSLMLWLLLAQAATLVGFAGLCPSPANGRRTMDRMAILCLVFALLPDFVAWTTAHTSADLLLYLFFGLGLLLSTALAFALRTAFEGPAAGRTFQLVLFRTLALNLLLAGALVLPWLASALLKPQPGSEAITERITSGLSRADADVIRAAFRADQGKLARLFGEVQQFRDVVSRTLAAQPFDPDDLAKARANLRVKEEAFFGAVQETVLRAASKLSQHGRDHLPLAAIGL